MGRLVPGFPGRRTNEFFGRLPVIGNTMTRLIATAGIYRTRLPTLLAAIALSIGIHSLFSVTIYLIARGLPGAAPSFAEHFLIVPMSMIAGALPLTPSGLGTFEAAIGYFYGYLGADNQVTVGNGVVVALGYRVIMVVTAMIGAGYYFASRREVAAVIDETEAT